MLGWRHICRCLCALRAWHCLQAATPRRPRHVGSGPTWDLGLRHVPPPPPDTQSPERTLVSLKISPETPGNLRARLCTHQNRVPMHWGVRCCFRKRKLPPKGALSGSATPRVSWAPEPPSVRGGGGAAGGCTCAPLRSSPGVGTGATAGRWEIRGGVAKGQRVRRAAPACSTGFLSSLAAPCLPPGGCANRLLGSAPAALFCTWAWA